MTRVSLVPADLENLITVLREAGYDVLGPTLESGVVTLGAIGSLADLPRGMRDDQSGGRYQTSSTGDGEYFGYAVGPDSLKATLFPPSRQVWTSESSAGSLRIRSAPSRPVPVAVVGARPCDAAAASVQDRVLIGGPYIDTDYARRRQELFLVVANCTRPALTCFCASMGTGPAASEGFDIALTEVKTETNHVFLAESGSARGQAVLDRLDLPDADPLHQELADESLVAAAGRQSRVMDPGEAADFLQDRPDHPQWESIASRCLACANCTMVCPTCFCVTTEPTSSLADGTAGQDRRWDSCFSLDYSFMGGSPVRASVASRYRQWLTHKLSTWIDQFGVSGCVGCGRCITWCPVGIDLTEEIVKLREPQDA